MVRLLNDMQVSIKRLEEFNDLYVARYGAKLQAEELEVQARILLRLYSVVYKNEYEKEGMD